MGSLYPRFKKVHKFRKHAKNKNKNKSSSLCALKLCTSYMEECP